MNNPVGNKKALSILQKSVKTNKVSHAYLFCGPEGVGKKLFALHFARILNCEKGDIMPCDTCGSCLKISKNVHPDVKIISTESKQIKIDMIKEGRTFLLSPPFEGPYKLLLIDDAHKMNKAASNALLKTLEEPPSNSVIILITAYAKNLLSTIISRCINITFSNLNDSELKQVLTGLGYQDDMISEIIPLSEGSPAKAIKLMDVENFKLTSSIKELIKNIDKKTFSDIFSFSENVVEKGREEVFFSIITELLHRNVMVLSSENVVNYEELSRAIINLEKAVNFAKLLRYNITRSFLVETFLISLKLCEDI